MDLQFTMQGVAEAQMAIKKVEKISGDIPDIVTRGTEIITARAKQLISEKGHVVTGSLRRSIRTVVIQITEDIIKGRVGSHLFYAYYVERLPDGGYLFQALVEKFDEVVTYISGQINKRLK